MFTDYYGLSFNPFDKQNTKVKCYTKVVTGVANEI